MYLISTFCVFVWDMNSHFSGCHFHTFSINHICLSAAIRKMGLKRLEVEVPTVVPGTAERMKQFCEWWALLQVCQCVTIENVMMCYLLTQADATDHTDWDTHRLVLPLVNVTLHNCDVCLVSSPMILADNEDLLSDPTLSVHTCVFAFAW